MPIEIGTKASLDAEMHCLDRIAQLGFPCAQVSSSRAELRTMENARALKRRAAELGVRLTSFGTLGPGPLRWDFTYGPSTQGLVPPAWRAMRVDSLCRWAEFAAEAGIPAILTHAGFLPENPADPEYPAIVEAIAAVGKRCKQLGLGFWFETGQETPVALLRHILATGLDNLGVNLDPANLVMYGKGSPVDAVAVYGRFVRAMHAKDGKPPTCEMLKLPGGLVETIGPETPIGQGAVDFRKLLPALVAAGFDGPILIEREIIGPEKERDVLAAHDLLHSILASLGPVKGRKA